MDRERFHDHEHGPSASRTQPVRSGPMNAMSSHSALSWLSAASPFVALLVSTESARATESMHPREPEPIHLIVEAPSCVSEDTLRADITALGASFREPHEGERARVFRVSVKEGADVSARLVVRDLVGRETIREVSKDDCAETARALALFLALALDEGVPPIAS